MKRENQQILLQLIAKCKGTVIVPDFLILKGIAAQNQKVFGFAVGEQVKTEKPIKTAKWLNERR